MPRPKKYCKIESIPDVTYFKPAGIPMRMLEEIRLSVEEAEAIRLKDLEGLEQEQGAEKMSISRPTFQRILYSARRKIADALLNGKSIRISGGKFRMAVNRFRCRNGHEWDIPFRETTITPPDACPECDTAGIEPVAVYIAGK